MAMPQDRLSVPTMLGQLLAPDDLGREGKTTDYELGGIALQDPSQGLRVQVWRLRVVGNEVRVAPPPYTSEVVLFTEPNITEASLSFDQNMRPLVAYMALGQARLWWYDPVPAEVTTLVLPAGVTSPYLSMDDKRDFATQNGSNDVLLFYVSGSRLCHRRQRDRFTSEITLRWLSGASASIHAVGMNDGNRLQIKLRGLSAKPLGRPYLSSWRERESTVVDGTTLEILLPPNIEAGGLVFVAVVHTSALTIPSGWSLAESVSCTNGSISQTLSVLQKASASPSDESAALALNQAASGFMSAMSFAMSVDYGQVTVLGDQSSAVNNSAVNSISVSTPASVREAGEMHIVIASTINASGASVTPLIPSGSTLIAGVGPNARIGAAYRLCDLGQSLVGDFVFDNGTPSVNGLAVVALRFGVAE